jgi:MinD-like ATPase involved in chromosome partitioning or flagellar assembly
MADKVRAESNSDRVSASEVEVDLREMLSEGELPPPRLSRETRGREGSDVPPAQQGRGSTAESGREDRPDDRPQPPAQARREAPAGNRRGGPGIHERRPPDHSGASASDRESVREAAAQRVSATADRAPAATTAVKNSSSTARLAAAGLSEGQTAADREAEPETPPSRGDDSLRALELFPEDVYRIVDGREVVDSRWSRWVARARGVLTSPPARQEERLDRDLRGLRVRGLSRGVTVACGSIKGGVGKTTLTLALADMLAEALRCGVVVVDADLEWGTAADSTPAAGRGAGTLSDVLAAREQISSPGALAPYLLGLPGGAQLLGGPTGPQQIEALGADDMQALLDLLQRFFPVVLLDLSPGIGLRGTIPRWAFSSADEIVAIATPTRGSLRRAGRMLGYLAQHRPQAPITLALNMVPRRPDQAMQRVIEVAQKNGHARRYAAIPRDDALMRQLDTGQLNINTLAQPTRIALKDLAYQLADNWCR